ncbi:MAG: 3-hydroxyacyl-ACP dehydratase FabZ [SAR324 cluster bacterium]|nr:3-hydroxyacyl-ACP dehydratase FabZ [SAR324 cluster bacterium]
MIDQDMKKTNPLNIDIVKQILPHRYPFLMIDKVLDHEYLKYCIAIKNVTYNEEFFSGHFPDYQLMPGVMQLEAMAQATGIASLYNNEVSEIKKPSSNSRPLLLKINDTRFRRMVVPGDILIIKSEIIKFKLNFCISWNTVSVRELDGTENLASEAKITLGLQK